MTAAAQNGTMAFEKRLGRVEDALGEHELRLAGAEKREQVLVDLSDAIRDVHKSLAGSVADHEKRLLIDGQQRAQLGARIDGLASAFEGMKAHVTRESEQRNRDIATERAAREQLSASLRAAGDQIEAASPTAHARSLMLASTLALSAIVKSVAEEVSQNHVAAWVIVAAILVGGFLVSRKRRSVP